MAVPLVETGLRWLDCTPVPEVVPAGRLTVVVGRLVAVPVPVTAVPLFALVPLVADAAGLAEVLPAGRAYVTALLFVPDVVLTAELLLPPLPLLIDVVLLVILSEPV